METLGSGMTALDAKDRLRILHSFFRKGEETIFSFDLSESMRLGRDFRDYICPDAMEIQKDHLKIGSRYCRTLFFKSFSTYIDDAMIKEICDMDRDMMLSITINPLSMEAANRLADRQTDNVETNIANWQRRQNKANNFSAIIPCALRSS